MSVTLSSPTWQPALRTAPNHVPLIFIPCVVLIESWLACVTNRMQQRWRCVAFKTSFATFALLPWISLSLWRLEEATCHALRTLQSPRWKSTEASQQLYLCDGAPWEADPQPQAKLQMRAAPLTSDHHLVTLLLHTIPNFLTQKSWEIRNNYRWVFVWVYIYIDR